MALLESPVHETAAVDPFDLFMDYDDESEDYRVADDGSNVRVDLTADNSVIGLER
jgi:hypothetical protein